MLFESFLYSKFLITFFDKIFWSHFLITFFDHKKSSNHSSPSDSRLRIPLRYNRSHYKSGPLSANIEFLRLNSYVKLILNFRVKLFLDIETEKSPAWGNLGYGAPHLLHLKYSNPYDSWWYIYFKIIN